jgi:hypothetical protein
MVGTAAVFPRIRSTVTWYCHDCFSFTLLGLLHESRDLGAIWTTLRPTFRNVGHGHNNLFPQGRPKIQHSPVDVLLFNRDGHLPQLNRMPDPLPTDRARLRRFCSHRNFDNTIFPSQVSFSFKMHRTFESKLVVMHIDEIGRDRFIEALSLYVGANRLETVNVDSEWQWDIGHHFPGKSN